MFDSFLAHSILIVSYDRAPNWAWKQSLQMECFLSCFCMLNTIPPWISFEKFVDYQSLIRVFIYKMHSRRGIGWHLLRAGEELITKMSPSREVYLHCRIVDEGPFNMYTKAGYSVVQTDSILTLLTLQRRRRLMRKELPASEDASVVVDAPPDDGLLDPWL